jgi:hypothetical protein
MGNRASILLGALALTALAGCQRKASPAPAPVASAAPSFGGAPIALDTLPRRKAGLWRQTLELAGSDKSLPPVESCADAASEAKLTPLGQHKAKDLCQNQAFARNADGSISFSVSCDLGPRGKTVSTGTISGDMNARYVIAMDSKTTDAPIAEANVEHRMTITATWLGACGPGQRGGDMIMADGRKVNLTDPAPGSRYP